MINKEQLAKDYGNSWMGSDIAWAAAQSGYLAGWDACQQNLQQCNVSGSLPLAEIIDMLNKAHEALAKTEISQDEYSPISWALIDAKKRIGVLLSGNDR